MGKSQRRGEGRSEGKGDTTCQLTTCQLAAYQLPTCQLTTYQLTTYQLTTYTHYFAPELLAARCSHILNLLRDVSPNAPIHVHFY